MATKKTLDLSSIVTVKGKAAPAHDIQNKTQGFESELKTAVTVRLNKAQYKKLKLYGVEHGETNQDIIVAALEFYLSRK